MDEQYYLYVIRRFEEKLKKLMPEKEYKEFVTEVAREGFKKSIEGMADSDFKKFCLANMEKITQ